MNGIDVRKYIGKYVLIILKNNFKFSAVIPEFQNNSFNITDKFGKSVLIDCDFISLIYEKEGEIRE